MKPGRSAIMFVFAVALMALITGCGEYLMLMEGGYVHFESNGGTAVPDQDAIGYIIEPETPVKIGYDFLGWYCDETCQKSWDFTDTLIEESMTLYAKWEVSTYTISYDENGATAGSVPDPQIKTYGEPLNLQSNHNGLSRDGLFFIGWNTTADGSGTAFEEGALYTQESDLTLYAVWVSGRPVTYDDNDADFGSVPSSQLKIPGETLILAENSGNLRKIGYEFGGWSNHDDGSGTVYTAGGSYADDISITLYAIWLACTDTAYTVEHYLQAVSGTDYVKATTETCYGTTAASVTAVAKSYTGFHENTTYISRVAEGSIAADGTTVLRLYYDRDSFTVQVQTNGGTAFADMTGIRYDATMGSPGTPSRMGYTFKGWYEDVGLTDAWDFSLDTVTENMSLYARWVPNTDTEYYEQHYYQNQHATGYYLQYNVRKESTTGATVLSSIQADNGFHEHGTHDSRVVSGVVSGDGQLILRRYYDRNTYTVTFDSQGGASVADATAVRFEDLVPAPEAPTRAGYTFVNWYTDADCTRYWPLTGETLKGDMTLYAKWAPVSDTLYTVEYYEEKTDGSGYTLQSSQNKQGTTGTDVTAPELVRDGFTENTSHVSSNPTGMILGDGSLVLKRYYDREVYSVNFMSNGGSESASLDDVLYAAIPATFDAPVKIGYTFEGWYRNSALSGVQWVSGSSRVYDDMTLYAKWAPARNTAYRVEYYKQDEVGDGYTIDASLTKTLSGTTGANVTAPSKVFPGFSEISYPSIARSYTGSIAADGSLVLKRFYDRVTYTFSFSANGGSPTPSRIYPRYGTKPELPDAITRTGYIFDGWYKNSSCTSAWTASDIAVANTLLYAKWTAATNIVYTVKYYLKNPSNGLYQEHTGSELALIGTTGHTVTAPEKSFTGYHENTGTGLRKVSGTIAVDGSLVLKRYYDCDTVYVTYETNGGSTLNRVGYWYGATVSTPTSIKTGYAFGGWYKDEALTEVWTSSDVITESRTLYAKWNPNDHTAYVVRYYRQNLNASTYSLYSTDTRTLYGATDSLVSSPEKDYTGFHEKLAYNLSKPTGVIAGDGSLVLDRYYDRDTYTVSYEENGGSAMVDSTGIQYESRLNPSTSITRAGYIFGGWYRDSGCYSRWYYNSSNLVRGDMTLYAKWTPAANTAYQCEYFKEKTDGSGYELSPCYHYTGTTDDRVTIAALGFSGFHENTSHESRVLSGTIAADGSLVLKRYYDRNTHTVTFREKDGTVLNTLEDLRYGSKIAEPAAPEKVGYTFYKWYDSTSLLRIWDFRNTAVTQDMSLYAKWTPNPKTAFTVEYYKQDVTGSGYTRDDSATKTLYGATDSYGYAPAVNFSGFSEYTSSSTGRLIGANIKPDGSLVLSRYYIRDTYRIDYNPMGGTGSPNHTYLRYGSSLTEPADPVRVGYVFGGWCTDSFCRDPWDFETDTLQYAQTLYAKWTEAADTAYTVQYYLQDASGAGYTVASDATDALTGTTLSSVDAPEKSFTGFHENSSNTSRVIRGRIEPDGSLLLKRYYDRDIFKITYEENGGSGIPDLSAVRYDTSPSLSRVYRAGYIHTGWFKDEALTEEWKTGTDSITEDTTLFAKWEAQTHIPYKLEYYQKNLGTTSYNRVWSDDSTLYGTTDTSVTAPVKSYSGFHENAEYRLSNPTALIAGDGSLVLKRYYDRNIYTISFESNGGTAAADGTAEYQATFNPSTTPTKTGYTFYQWYKDASLTDDWSSSFDHVTEDMTLYAKWTPNSRTPYLEEHWYQDVDGEGYTRKYQSSRTGVTDSRVTMSRRYDDHYTENTLASIGSSPTGTIAADGSLVLKRYYDRDTYTVSFNSMGGSAVDEITSVRYEDTIDAPAAPAKEGYTHAGWYTDSSCRYVWSFSSSKVSADTTLYAKWAPATETPYTVEHYLQDATGSGYTIDAEATEHLSGTTDATVNSVAKSYDHYSRNTGVSGSKLSGTVEADGSLVLKVYYDRRLVRVYFNTNGSSTNSWEINNRYDAIVAKPSDPRKSGYTFAGWYGDEELEHAWDFTSMTTTASTTRLYAKWDIDYSAQYGYTVLSDHVVINSYFGSDAIVNVPAVIEGKPVTKIGANAFWVKSNLKQVTIPEGVKTIGDFAFYLSSNITSISLPSTLEELGIYVFANMSSLSEISIPAGIKELPNYSFNDCTELSKVTLSSGLTKIGDYAFRGCDLLRTIVLPDSLKTIGSNAFSSMDKLQSVMFNTGLETISTDAFSYCPQLTTVDMSRSSLIEISDSAFRGCTALTSLIFNEGLENIGTYAFRDCSSLKTVSLPESLKAIRSYAFYRSTSLSTVNIRQGVVTIDPYAFWKTPSTSHVYCEISAKPVGWHSFWFDKADTHVTWGYEF